jgi:hypothetical protein
VYFWPAIGSGVGSRQPHCIESSEAICGILPEDMDLKVFFSLRLFFVARKDIVAADMIALARGAWHHRAKHKVELG